MDAPNDTIEIFLQPGEFYFGTQKTRIRTLLGSCVAITLWHPTRHIGGMCHYLLPRQPQRKPDATPMLDGRYAEDAMKMFLAEIMRARTRAAEYQVKLFGGGRMFAPGVNPALHGRIPNANVEFGRGRSRSAVSKVSPKIWGEPRTATSCSTCGAAMCGCTNPVSAGGAPLSADRLPR